MEEVDKAVKVGKLYNVEVEEKEDKVEKVGEVDMVEKVDDFLPSHVTPSWDSRRPASQSLHTKEPGTFTHSWPGHSLATKHSSTSGDGRHNIARHEDTARRHVMVRVILSGFVRIEPRRCPISKLGHGAGTRSS